MRSDFQNLNILPGINDLILESTVSGVFWNFRIIAPEDASETNKRPLVLRLHGGAANIAPNAQKTTGSQSFKDQNLLPIVRFPGTTLLI